MSYILLKGHPSVSVAEMKFTPNFVSLQHFPPKPCHLSQTPLPRGCLRTTGWGDSLGKSSWLTVLHRRLLCLDPGSVMTSIIIPEPAGEGARVTVRGQQVLGRCSE